MKRQWTRTVHKSTVGNDPYSCSAYLLERDGKHLLVLPESHNYSTLEPRYGGELP